MSMRIACLLILSTVWSFVALAHTGDSSPSTPYKVVSDTTDQVLVVVGQARNYYADDPQRFYGQVDHILDHTVDFKSFTLGVMGRYGSKRGYDQLTTAAEKTAYKNRIKRFSETFRKALVQTYAKGLLAFDSDRTEVVIPETIPETNSVIVTQKIYSEDDDEPYTVLYKMRQNRSGQWKLRNITIESVNLGKVYQSQFASMAKQYDGNIDEVIDNWVVVPAGMEKPANAKRSNSA